MRTKIADLLGQSELLDKLREERASYGLYRTARVSKQLAEELSRNFKNDFDSDPVSLSDRSDFGVLGDHYDSSVNLIRTNLKETSPATLAHELGHAFTMGREVRGHEGIMGKGKFYAKSLAGILGNAAITAGTADLVSAKRDSRGYLSGSALLGAGIAASVGSSLSEYLDESRATSEGLKSLRKTLENPDGVSVGWWPKKVFSKEQVNELMKSGEGTLEAALATYRRSLPMTSLVSMGLSGALGAALGRLSNNSARNRLLIGATSLASSALSAAALESAISSRVGTKEREALYESAGDKKVHILPSRRLRN